MQKGPAYIMRWHTPQADEELLLLEALDMYGLGDPHAASSERRAC